MKSFITLTRQYIKNTFIFSDYCFWSLFDFSKFKIIDRGNIKNIVIIRRGAIGELVMLSPILPILKKELKCNITLMLSPGSEDIFKNNPHINNILFLDPSKQKNIENLKKGKFDLALIFSPCSLNITSACLKAGIKYRIGCFKGVKDGLAFFFTRRSFPLRKIHAVEKHLDIIQKIGISLPREPGLEVYLSNNDKKYVKSWLISSKIKKYIIVHPGFGFSDMPFPSRWWPEERYAEIIEKLIKKTNYNIILTGNKNEEVFINSIMQKCNNKDKVINSAGLFNINQLAALVSNSQLVIAPSTGIIHIASALGKKIVQLSGKDDQLEWHPWTNKEDYRILFHPEVCTECDLLSCRKKTQECMLAITVEEVINTTLDLLMRNGNK